jgi:rod shape-determining protein MreC
MVGDHHNNAFHRMRSSMAVIVTPLQSLANLPAGIFNWIVTDFTSKQKLLSSNAQLRAENSLLQAKLQKQLAIEAENKQLRALLASSTQTVDKVTIAKLLAVSPDPFVHKIVLNQGGKTGVFVGQPVLDAYGVMGQVVQVGRLSSLVMLLTDVRSAVPVQIDRNGMRAIAVGNGESGLLQLQHIVDTADVRVGDSVITSGLGEHYPFGYPVGTVVSVNKNSGDRFANILVKPAAHINRSLLVLLVWTAGVRS